MTMSYLFLALYLIFTLGFTTAWFKPEELSRCRAKRFIAFFWLWFCVMFFAPFIFGIEVGRRTE